MMSPISTTKAKQSAIANAAVMEDDRSEGEIQPETADSTSENGTSASNKQRSGSGSGTGEESTSSMQLARNESQMVRYSKILVIVVIVMVAASIGAVTYVFVHNQEETTYQDKFEDVSNEVMEFTHVHARQILDNLESFATSITSHANAMNQSWPFVTYPDFQVEATLSNKLTGSSTLSIVPVVDMLKREAWEQYSVEQAPNWLASAHAYDKTVDEELYVVEKYETVVEHNESLRWNVTGIVPSIWKLDANNSVVMQGAPEELATTQGGRGYYTPVWQRAPASDFSPYVNIDLMGLADFAPFVAHMLHMGHPVFTDITDASYLLANYEGRFPPELQTEPHSYLLQPIYSDHTSQRTIVGFLTGYLRWGFFFQNVLSTGQKGIIVVLTSTCGATFSYEIRGQQSFYLGEGRRYDPKFEGMQKTFDIIPEQSPTAMEMDPGHRVCLYSAQVYPTEEWKSKFFSNDPIYYTIVVISCFVATTLVFVLYDFLVQRRQEKVMESATKTHAIVSSLFPSNVRDRLMDEMKTSEEQANAANNKKSIFSNQNNRLQNNEFKATSAGGGHQSIQTSEAIFGSQPIADLFPECTIMFADLVGFTAWASIRDPTAVFTLLETIYHSFDVIAKRRRVFKVETVGDCYVACAGLPTPRKDHALVMTKFANECLLKMSELVRELENRLGPDTGDLDMRIGLHSGPVTAGVLRGEKGRFQLFGDSMNTASRLESTGERNKIHVSRETADLLIASGKEKWITERMDKVIAKGKGELQTYFVNVNAGSSESGSANTRSHTGSHGSSPAHKQVGAKPALSRVEEASHASDAGGLSKKSKRLVNWNVDILAKLLKQVVASRVSSNVKTLSRDKLKKLTYKNSDLFAEVKDVISLPKFEAQTFQKHVDPNSVELSTSVWQQLNDYVTRVACLYREENPFHNFEHASHVTMSVTKLMSRIVNPNEVLTHDGESSDTKIAENLHDYTFGITSDPLTQFSCVLSALIHDADHPGISNATLIKEDHPLAEKYNGRSMAEQYSVDVSWNILMEPEFEDLRACIYANEDEFSRFRSIIVNIVLATDIMDKELGALRKARWDIAFSDDAEKEQAVGNEDQNTVNRKATIVLEHLIQASDVAHTMQHWHVYKKWNQRLFMELYRAYLNGHMDKDPSTFWYNGEIGFFDNYIIPLAKKLETCGVFGVSSQEYLNYAVANRREWAEKGQEIVKGYMEVVKKEFDDKQPLESETAGANVEDSNVDV